MKKTVSCILSAAALFSLCLTGCNRENPETAEFEIWSTYATAKVGQSALNNGNFVKEGAKFDVQMMKNETEGGQIVITPDRNVKSFDLEICDLKTEDGKILPASQIDVYQQKYIEVRQKRDYNDVYGIGEYVPDMLLPMEIAVEYGENTVRKGNNQGIYVEFDSAGVEAGTYRGNFTLTCDEEEYSVPVTVTVWDFEYAGRRTFQSCFVLYQSSLLRSEYDDSQETVDAYVDFLLDYKVNACVRNSHYNNFDLYGEEWLADLEKRKDNENYNSVYIPYQFATNFTTYNSAGLPTAAAQECLKYVLALVKKSTPEFSYIDYAYFYPFELDEADINASRQTPAENLLKSGGEVDQLLALAVKTLEEEGWFDTLSEEYAARVKESVLNVPVLFTNVELQENWTDDFSATFCPYLSVFGSGFASDRYAAQAERYGKNVWTYTCVGPNYPYPTFHLDDYNLGTRVSGWMEKYYGIDGYLYWATTNSHFKNEEYKYLDPYEDANRYPGADGDGYLTYPGKYYGSETPFPSLRLVAYRDSMEDYDMLCVYENLLREYYGKYGLGELNFNDYVEDLYSDLFNAAIYDTDDSLLFAARRELASRIAALQTEEEILVTRGYAQGKNELTVYANVSALEINGQTVSGTEIGTGRYRFALSDAETSLTVKTADGTLAYSYFTAEKLSLSESGVSISQDSAFTLNGDTLNVTLKSVLIGKDIGVQTISFNPNVTVGLGRLGETKNLCFRIKNTGGVPFDAYVELIADGYIYEVGSLYLEGGKEKDARLAVPAEIATADSVTLRVRMSNVTRDSRGEYALFSDRSFALSDLRTERT